MEVNRTHDKLYLNENYKENPKEYFKFIKNEIIGDLNLKSDDTFSLLDIGCETGSFLYFIRKNFPCAKLSGMDVMPSLLEQVNNGINNNLIETFAADISNINTLPAKKYDIVTMMGVLSIFDDFENILNNALHLVNLDGILYIFGIFNPKELDILIKSRSVKDKTSIEEIRQEHWESGWNYFSKYSIEKYCQSRMIKCEFLPFNIGLDIPEHIDDPLRSWTINLPDQEKIIVNGLQIIHHFYLCKIFI